MPRRGAKVGANSAKPVNAACCTGLTYAVWASRGNSPLSWPCKLLSCVRAREHGRENISNRADVQRTG